MITFEMSKRSFFDTEVVLKAMDKAQVKALSKAGAFVRTRARSSIRKSKKVSNPGEPPKSKKGQLRKFLFFSYDFATRSVVIGPSLLPSFQRYPETTPAILEFGATLPPGSRVLPLNRDTREVLTGREEIQKARDEKKLWPRKLTQATKHEPRPYMKPALMAEVAAGSIPQAFRNLITS